ncbi:MAG: efflux RND transporter permease subunit [Sulfurihydrogenibium sp.]
MNSKDFFVFLIRRKVAVILIFFMFGIIGYYTSNSVTKDIFPNVYFPRVEVAIENGYTPTKQMLLEITKPAEESLKTVQGVEKIVSKTSIGSVEINLYFNWSTNPFTAYQLVLARVSELKNVIPSTAKVVVRQATPSMYPIGIYAIGSDTKSQTELTDILYYKIKPLIISIPGVYDLEIKAPQWQEFHIVVDTDKLNNYNISLDYLKSVIYNQTKIDFLGVSDLLNKQYIVTLYQKPEDVYKLLDVKIPLSNGRYINLSDVAVIVNSKYPSRATSGFSNVKNAVVFNILRQPDADTTTVIQNVDRQIDIINKSLEKEGVKIYKSYDSSVFIKESIKSVRDAIVLGSIIAVVILFIFLRKVKISFATLLILPMVFFITIIGIKVLGLDFNLFSLGGMAAAIGGLVDHVIIVVENIDRHLKYGKDKLTAIIDGSKEILPIMTGATLISTLVFLPLLFVPGVVGVFLKQLALVLVLTYIVSQIAAIFLVPVIAYILLPNRFESKEDFITRLEKRYEKLLERLFKYDFIAVVLVFVVMLSGFLLYRSIPATFLPKWDEGSFVVDFTLPAGTSLEESYKTAMEMGKILNSIPEVKNWTLRIGTSLGHVTEQPNVGDFLVVLKENKSRSIFEIKEEVRKRIEDKFNNLEEFDLPQVIEDRLADILGEEAPISVLLYGYDPDKLVSYGFKLRDMLREKPLLEEVNLKTAFSSGEIRIRLKPEAQSIYGLSLNDLYQQLYNAYWGSVVGNIVYGEKVINLRLISTDKQQFLNPESMKVYSNTVGRFIPLSEVAEVSYKSNVPEVTHYNLSPVAVITVRFKGNNMSDAVKVVNQTIQEANLPSDITPVVSGFYRQQQESFKNLMLVILAAITFIGIFVMILFVDFKITLSILLAVVLTLTGVLVALFITGKPLDITGLIGMLIVLSIVINNNVLIFDFYKNSPEENIENRILYATASRFRPITMTMLSNAFAMLPIALAIGSGTQILQDLAISMIGGLLFAIFVNLLIIPLFFHFLARLLNH